MKYLERNRLPALLDALAQAYEVFAPVKVGEHVVLRRHVPGAGGEVVWNDYRLAESLKPLWFQTGKVVARWTKQGPAPGPEPHPRAIMGAKACDLKAVAVLDRVFRDHAFKEPAWCAAREKNLVVAGDCTACAASCFCTMVGDKPWPEALYDLLLSPVEGGFLVESATGKGEAVLAANPRLFADPPPGARETRDRRRADVEAAVREQNRPFAVRDPFAVSVEKNVKTRIWGKLAATCVECNACNLVCPTCHCFLLEDVPTPEGAARVSHWDSCFHAGYARMAGGGTPRLQLTERFKNHYYHKFVSFPRNWGITACSGCGRCVDACMGKIDKRRCLHRLETEWIPTEVAEEIR